MQQEKSTHWVVNNIKFITKSSTNSTGVGEPDKHATSKYGVRGIYDVEGSVCFILKFSPQRGDKGRKGGSANFNTKHTEPLSS